MAKIVLRYGAGSTTDGAELTINGVDFAADVMPYIRVEHGDPERGKTIRDTLPVLWIGVEISPGSVIEFPPKPARPEPADDSEPEDGPMDDHSELY